MGSPETILFATFSRLRARLGNSLADALTDFAIFARTAPERFRKEWDLFKEEVRTEADRLEYRSYPGDSKAPSVSTKVDEIHPQELIDKLRETVAELTTKIEESD